MTFRVIDIACQPDRQGRYIVTDSYNMHVAVRRPVNKISNVVGTKSVYHIWMAFFSKSVQDLYFFLYYLCYFSPHFSSPAKR